MKSLLLFVAVVVAIFALVPTSEAVCANQAVYDDCMRRGQTQLSSCAFDDWVCKCSAHNAIQLCFLQCPDDQDIQNLGKSHETEVQQSCTFASSQLSASSAKATTATTTNPSAVASPQATTPPPAASQSPTASPAAAGSSSAEPSSTKSFANINKINVLVAAVPFIIIGQFI